MPGLAWVSGTLLHPRRPSIEERNPQIAAQTPAGFNLSETLSLPSMIKLTTAPQDSDTEDTDLVDDSKSCHMGLGAAIERA